MCTTRSRLFWWVSLESMLSRNKARNEVSYWTMYNSFNLTFHCFESTNLCMRIHEDVCNLTTEIVVIYLQWLNSQREAMENNLSIDINDFKSTWIIAIKVKSFDLHNIDSVSFWPLYLGTLLLCQGRDLVHVLHYNRLFWLKIENIWVNDVLQYKN